MTVRKELAARAREAVRASKRETGRTQGEMALLAGYDPSYFSKVLNGNDEVSAMIQRLEDGLAALGIDRGVLTAGEGVPVTPEGREAAELLDAAPPALRAHMINLLKAALAMAELLPTSEQEQAVSLLWSVDSQTRSKALGYVRRAKEMDEG